jgi:hypothetical protein
MTHLWNPVKIANYRFAIRTSISWWSSITDQFCPIGFPQSGDVGFEIVQGKPHFADHASSDVAQVGLVFGCRVGIGRHIAVRIVVISDGEGGAHWRFVSMRYATPGAHGYLIKLIFIDQSSEVVAGSNRLSDHA